MSVQKQIEEALSLTKGIDTLNSAELTREQHQAIRDLDIFAYQWLTHQQSIISQQAEQLKLAVNALEWYANDSNWGTIKEYGAFVSDGGEQARTALSSIQSLGGDKTP